MVTGTSVEMPAAASLGGGGSGNFDDFERDLEAMLREAQPGAGRAAAVPDLEHELSPYRSGSAPPTVEGARAAIGGLFAGGPADAFGENGLSEEEMRSHPAYLSYYYSNERLNPRLPPPMVSKEDWRAAQRFHALGGIGDPRRRESWNGDGGSGSSLFSMQPGLPAHGGQREWNGLNSSGGRAQRNLSQQQSTEWLDRDADGLIGLGARRNSFADAIEEELVRSASVSEHLSRHGSRNAFDNVVDSTRLSDSQLMHLNGVSKTMDNLHSRSSTPNLVRVQSLGSSMSQSFASALNSSSRNTIPDGQPIGRSPSPFLPPIGGRMFDGDKKSMIGSNGLDKVSSHAVDTADMTAALSRLGLSKNMAMDSGNHLLGQFYQETVDQSELSNIPSTHMSYNDFSKKNDFLNDLDLSKLTSNGQINLQKQQSSSNLFKKVAPVGSKNSAGSSSLYHGAYSTSQGLPMLNSQVDAGSMLRSGVEGFHLNRTASQLGSGLQVPIGDQLYAQYLQGASDSAAQAASRLDPSLERNYISNSHVDLPIYHKATLLAQQKLQYDMPYLSRPAALNHGLYANPAFGLGMAYPTSPISSSIRSSFGPRSPLRSNDRVSRLPSMTRSSVGGSTGSWNPENGVMEEGPVSSLLDEFKNNKTRCYELSDIVDHVVEFSGDQFGSRFIQQKLETASVEEKNKIFPEIFPHARVLMTDVFGNYVIQKFFEHGTEIQRKQLANQLIGHVLPLSLQMYGCRVIQKALEVVDVDYQTQMVLELDGAVMKCVRDQNGNHVIQKCIECVPQEKIQFIIVSFYGQVVALSTHPYGCRVIQRVLEHCDDPKTQSIMMDEILQSVCTLAQDQYGNYVVQHVLQHGKPEERSATIKKLAGQIVKMSQQKFASNVVEKCLTYGSPEERQFLINEMLGSTDENEPLQAMMKDQFGNYVVQKVLETCDDQNRELILSRVKVHLNALKKLTYGKHLVARVEKLLVTGERHSGNSSYST